MARPQNTSQRRLQIVNAMISVMAVKGYENASIQSIGQKAGLTSGLIHYHFKKKQDILIEVIKVINQRAKERYEDLLAHSESAKEKIEAFIDAALSLGAGSDLSAVAAWVVIGGEAIRQEEVRLLYQSILKKNKLEVYRLLQSYFKELDMKVSKAALSNLSAMIVTSIEGAYQLSITANDVCPRGYAAKTLKLMVFAAVEKEL